MSPTVDSVEKEEGLVRHETGRMGASEPPKTSRTPEGRRAWSALVVRTCVSGSDSSREVDKLPDFWKPIEVSGAAPP